MEARLAAVGELTPDGTPRPTKHHLNEAINYLMLDRHLWT
jgi:hypothetical protein